ncbi:MAG: ABC transporter transmembrane domain-containing protein, partial [Saprospiraceae bacterium]|nr:ABC transporter transmembrane domain-containing protein [Saprospiraceae bacterium]
MGFWRLVGLIRNYKLEVSLHVLFNILMAIFTIVSIPAIIPFFDILFRSGELQAVEPVGQLNWSNALEYMKFQFGELVRVEGRERALAIICAIIVGIFFLKNLFRYLAMFFMAPVRNGIVRDMRNQLYQKILALPLGFFSEEKKGDLIARMSSDVHEIEWSILNVLEAAFKEPLIILGSLFFMLYVSPSLTAFVFVLLLFTAFIIGGISRTLKRQSFAAQEEMGGLLSQVEETLSGIRIVKAFNAEKYLRAKYEGINEKYRDLQTRILRRRDLSSPLSEFLGISVVAVLLWYGSSLVFENRLDAGTFMAFIFAFYNIITPAKSFSAAYYSIQKGTAAIDRVEKILHASDTVPEMPAA